MDKYIHIRSITAANLSYQAANIASINSYGYGVSAALGWSDASTGATFGTTTNSYTTHFDPVIDLLVTNRQKVILNLSEGPPTSTSWKALNSTNSWAEKNRPPSGLHTTIKNNTTALIAYVKAKYTAAGLTSTDYVKYKHWVEGGKGGANGPYDTSAGPGNYNSPYSGYDEGTWDDNWHTMMNTITGATWDSHQVIWPSFECQSVSSTASSAVFNTELTTYFDSDGSTWRTNLTQTQNVIGINIYPEQFTVPVKNLSKFQYEFDQKTKRVIRMIKAQANCPASVKFFIGETGYRISTSLDNANERLRYRKGIEEVAEANPDIIGLSHYSIRDDDWGFELANGTATYVSAYNPFNPAN